MQGMLENLDLCAPQETVLEHICQHFTLLEILHCRSTAITMQGAAFTLSSNVVSCASFGTCSHTLYSSRTDHWHNSEAQQSSPKYRPAHAFNEIPLVRRILSFTHVC
jgi:hypothetical protein